MMTTLPVGRFAPSPTGPLHSGSLIAAIGSFCLARRLSGRWLLRMEDLDTPRVVPGAADQILRTLERLGLHWDGEILWQSRRQQAYQQALESLTERGLIFPCGCSRKEILASAPHPGEEGPIYPGHCRNGLAPGRRPRALRVRVPRQVICFTDGVFGPISQGLEEAVGDFVLRRADGLFAYQLAVVVDDAESGVNQVVRGADLLTSTPRQIFLHAAFGNPIPDYIHLPLATDLAGIKLSKRHGAAISSGDSQAMVEALRFLGQQVPREMEGEAPQQLLSWAVAHFDIRKIAAAQGGQILTRTKKAVAPLTAGQNAVK
ncbi:MAG: tRNA glutamyl-Q(34) synthetase GluQRS [Desulfuromonas sp.]|nr:MAG: tRNA glutamyl-Q(34) synthetase GluQRS [Desulfuromonas sp.]